MCYVLKLDPSTFELSLLPSLHQERASFRAVLTQNCQYILAIGGINSHGPLSSVERFDTLTQTWTVLSSMNEPRYGHASFCCFTK